jgi:glucosylceramidase
MSYLSINCLVLLIIFWFDPLHTQTPCKIMTFEHGNVCQCTEDYCDTIAPLGIIPNGQAALYESTSEHAETHRLTRLTNLEFETHENPNITNLIEINYKKTYQKIIGFGGAFTDSSSIVAHRLSENLKNKLLEQYFGNEGLQYNIGRIPMAGCDFSTYLYSYDSVVNDFDLEYFSISMDFPYKIPFIKSSINMSNENIYLFGSPWNGPDWLKNLSNPIGTINGVAGDKYHKTWARYFSKFIEAYESEGIPIWGITTQNEYGQVKDFNGLSYTNAQLADFIRIDLGPELRKSHPSIKLMTYDDDMDLLVVKIDEIIKRNTSIIQYIDGIAVHWYATEDMTFPDFYELFLTKLEYPQFFYLPSEASEGYMKINQGPRLGMWKRGMHYALSIIGDLLVGASGWTDWNIVLDLEGGPNHIQNYLDSPIIANTTSGTVFYKNPMFYTMGHFSKFIPRDSIRIDTKVLKEEKSLLAEPLRIVNFLTPNNQMVIVALNYDRTHTQSVQILDTNQGYLTLILLPESIQTIVYNITSRPYSKD